MKKYGILSILFLLLSLAGGLYLVKTNQDNRNKAASGCWATCNCSCGKSFCADPKGKGCNSECNEACGTSPGGPTSPPVSGDGCNGPLSASACKGVNPGSSCTGGFDGTCKRTTDNNCACVANNPTAGGPTSTKPKVCTEGNLGTLCCNSSKVACQQHRYADCSTTCTDNCGIFNNSACTPPSGVTPTYIPGGGGVTWSCNAMSGTRGGYNCSGYQNCGGYRSGTPCDPGEYVGGGLQAPIDAKTCQCSNGVWVVGKGATCDGLCACTNNVCVNCSPTPPNRSPSVTPTKKPTATPTKKPTATPTKTPTLTPTLTPTPGPSATPTPSSNPTPTLTPVPTLTLTPTPTTAPPNNCGGTCGSNINCGSDLFCHNGFCRNPSCPDQSNCVCQQSPTSTPAPTNTPIPTSVIAEGPSPTRIILPQSGVEFPAQMLAIFGGIVTLLGFLILL